LLALAFFVLLALGSNHFFDGVAYADGLVPTQYTWLIAFSNFMSELNLFK
jgi:hypothetical protein